MAGWNPERMARRRSLQRPRQDDARAEAGASETCELLPGLAEAMSEVMAEPARAGRRGESDRASAGTPHLVSDNSASPELQLSRIVELEIIPRLMLLHGATGASPQPSSSGFAITLAHVETLAHLAVDGDAERARLFVGELVASGAPLDQVFLQLLAPAAQLMGRMWADDVYSFSQVTIGLWRLQQVLHLHGQRFLPAVMPQAAGYRVLLATEPGSQHTFGLTMLGEFFVRDGWDVSSEPAVPWGVLADRLANEHCDLLGVSVGVDTSVPSVASAILELRRASRNPRLFVMVGGPAAHIVPELARLCGADSMALDAPAALAIARRWMRSLNQAH